MDPLSGSSVSRRAFLERMIGLLGGLIATALGGAKVVVPEQQSSSFSGDFFWLFLFIPIWLASILGRSKLVEVEVESAPLRQAGIKSFEDTFQSHLDDLEADLKKPYDEAMFSRKKDKDEGKSFNEVALEALVSGTGESIRPKRDFSEVVGSLSKAEAEKIEEEIRLQHQIDVELWK